MSRYSDKKNTPTCAHRECMGHGTILARAADRPVWVCPTHAEQLNRQ